MGSITIVDVVRVIHAAWERVGTAIAHTENSR